MSAVRCARYTWRKEKKKRKLEQPAPLVQCDGTGADEVHADDVHACKLRREQACWSRATVGAAVGLFTGEGHLSSLWMVGWLGWQPGMVCLPKLGLEGGRGSL